MPIFYYIIVLVPSRWCHCPVFPELIGPQYPPTPLTGRRLSVIHDDSSAV
jgi:hypothetical protein